MFPNAYLSTDMGKVYSDNNAIYRVFFIANVGNFVIYVITVLFVSFLIERLTSNIARFEKSNAQLGRYFSPQIKEEIEASEIEVIGKNPKGLDVAILFTDIVNFTKLSEKMDPKDVLSLLSDYQSIMIDSIFAHKGTVDKFVGDAVMANFGTPKSVGNDAQNAFDCALTMNKKLKEWNKTRELNGLQKISHRIGIHFGSCVVGNIGNELRTEFAVIGDPVNVASRICDSCKELATNFVISQDLANRIVLTGKYEKVKNFSIRGREESIDLVKFYS
jgi:adenylate cyclase